MSALCNSITAIVYQERDDGLNMEIHHQPGREGANTSHTNHLVRSREGSASHYAAFLEFERTTESVDAVSRVATLPSGTSKKGSRRQDSEGSHAYVHQKGRY